ncbi:hypothetical protein MC885_015130, partial [Smutsia gigantea]
MSNYRYFNWCSRRADENQKILTFGLKEDEPPLQKKMDRAVMLRRESLQNLSQNLKAQTFLGTKQEYPQYGM